MGGVSMESSGMNVDRRTRRGHSQGGGGCWERGVGRRGPWGKRDVRLTEGFGGEDKEGTPLVFWAVQSVARWFYVIDVCENPAR